MQRAWRNRAAERLGRRHLQKVRYVQRAWRYRASELPCPFTTHEATMVAYHLGYIPYDIDSYVPPPYCYLPGNYYDELSRMTARVAPMWILLP